MLLAATQELVLRASAGSLALDQAQIFVDKGSVEAIWYSNYIILVVKHTGEGEHEPNASE
ncbi:hypothetical protein EON65_44845 [archaeon]|nr:MAG: hypothetical protein EON65_44845 [archaeon]